MACRAQVQRRRHVPPVPFGEHSELPCMVPEGEHWAQCIATRTFKARVIDLVLLRLPHLRLPRSPDSRAAFFKSRPRKGSAFLM